MKRERVLVGMSGGIDSSATCMLLQEHGYEVVGLTMRVWDLPKQFATPEAELPGFIAEAKSLADRLGIEHYVADEREAFKQVVVRNFTEEYLGGRTPNPCVMCNPLFKFRVLTEWADRLNCAYVATGHYVRLVEDKGSYFVQQGADELKDQSYFLWRLGQEVLKRCLFPLGGMRKTDIREYLAQKGYMAKAKGGESMEVCFIEGDYRDFLRAQIPDFDQRVKPGKYVDAAGRVLGEHQGAALYTVGQRRGLGIALGHPAFVLKINAEKNTVMLGGAEELLVHHMLVDELQLVDEALLLNSPDLSVKIRYRSAQIACSVRFVDHPVGGALTQRMLLVTFAEPASAVTPGQSAVFYLGERVVAGGYIASQRGVAVYGLTK